MHPCDQIVILSQFVMMTKIALANLLNIANFRAPPENAMVHVGTMAIK